MPLLRAVRLQNEAHCVWNLGPSYWLNGSPPAAWRLLMFLPLLGVACLSIASLSDGVFLFVVREDGPLEWVQVVAYMTAVVISTAAIPGLRRRGDRRGTIALVGLAVFALVCVGEELSWGQRLLGFDTPVIGAQNRQGELTIHNDARVDELTRICLLFAGLYGLIAPLLIRRHTPFVPPSALIFFFAVVAAYYAFRLQYLGRPSYEEAKFSEWPETCFALALALWCKNIGAQESEERRTWVPDPRRAISGEPGDTKRAR